jgi:tryptophanyl-tRNA synthetase
VELTREIVRRFNANFGLEIEDALSQQRELLKKLGNRLPKEALDRIPAPDPNAFARFKAAVRKHVLEVGFANLIDEVQEAGEYLKMSPVLREPAYLAAETPRLPGLDGRRMAKSYGNAIWLSDPPAEIRTKILKHMVTDPQRVRRTDPGRPEVCPVFDYHKLFSPPAVIAWSDQGCRTAGIGCVECKNAMADNLIKWIEPIQTRRKEFEAHPQQVWDILDGGSDKARKAAKRTMQRVRNAIFKWDDARKPAKT